MNPDAAKAGRVALTLLAVLAALLVARQLWLYYKVDPWTRDGRVRADVVPIAPDVPGLVTEVLVHDNQPVRAGDLLFRIDPPRYQVAVRQAEANIAGLRVQLAQAQREDARNRRLGELVSAESREQGASRIEQLRAGLAQAQAALTVAQLNLERTEVRASVNGQVTNLDLRPGVYAAAGKPVLTLVDLDSLYVAGYFEETKIPRIHVGDRARVRLMGDDAVLAGHVDSIAAGIEDRERSGSSSGLANVNPTFNWIRLPQRIPVRVKLDGVPAGARLIMGRTASVEIVPPQPPARRRGQR